MNRYITGEVAYKNGYELGLKVKQNAYSEQFAKGFYEALNEDCDPIDFCGVICNFAEELIDKYKVKAVKEFAERLKKELLLYRKECRKLLDNGGVFAMDKARKKVDNLVKEMEGKKYETLD